MKDSPVKYPAFLSHDRLKHLIWKKRGYLLMPVDGTLGWDRNKRGYRYSLGITFAIRTATKENS